MERMIPGRICLVTGSGRGIGRGAAQMLGRHGGKVALCGLGADELAETARLVRAEGAEVLVFELDVADRSAVDAAVTSIERAWGSVQLLVNNAAILPTVPFGQTTPEIWDRCIGVNLTGYYNMAWRVYPAMRLAGDGAMIHVSSMAGQKGFLDESVYCATKFGVEGLSQAMAMDLAPEGIMVVHVRPGIMTKPTNLTMADYDRLTAEERSRWVDPIVMAEAFVALGRSREMELSGHRFSLWAVSEHVRSYGWDAPLNSLFD